MNLQPALLLAAATLLCAPVRVLAHPGHGAGAEVHWHATDTSGLLLVAGAAAVAWWFAGRGR